MGLFSSSRSPWKRLYTVFFAEHRISKLISIIIHLPWNLFVYSANLFIIDDLAVITKYIFFFCKIKRINIANTPSQYSFQLVGYRHSFQRDH